MKRNNAVLMFLLIGLVSIITLVVILQRPVDWVLISSAGGFALFTFAWVGMYFSLKRELPEHALVEATYVNFGGNRRAGFRNVVALVQSHFERHRFDFWSLLLIAGAVMFAASLVGHVR